jgi:uncharacterized protein with FMN-binding domain
MRRTPIVITATVAGLAGVLAFHTTPSRLNPVSSGPTPTPHPTASGPGGSAEGASSPSQPGSAASPKPAGTTPGGTKTVDGPVVNYNYGHLSVSVTVSGSKITKVGIASLDDFGVPRSVQIDQQSIPILEQQAVQAQSADIQGVSGASYTSYGFEHSLQAALRTLGVR